MNTTDIAVIGGGASGLMAAICAKEENGGIRVAVLERYERVGRKLLATGNGRCNLSNLQAARGGYHGDAEFAGDVISRYPPKRVLSRFSDIGVRTYADPEGRAYPLCNQASAVLDALRLACAERDIETVCGFDAASIKKGPAGFTVLSRDGRSLRASRVIVCAGSVAAPQLGGTDAGIRLLRSAGHATVAVRPAISQLETPPDEVRPLKGIRFEGAIRLLSQGKTLREEEGEILFTEYGLSGIAAMQLARQAGELLCEKRRAEVSLRLLPEDASFVREELRARANAFSRRETAEFLTGLVAKRIGQTLMKRAGIQPLSRPCASVSDAERNALSVLLTDWRMPLTGVRGFENAQVAAGGVSLSGFSLADLQSRILPGLYAAGEVLNVDGDCGGYNLQWAWSSGMLAGESAAKSLAFQNRRGEKR